jgi:hypothetical protein
LDIVVGAFKKLSAALFPGDVRYAYLEFARFGSMQELLEV